MVRVCFSHILYSIASCWSLTSASQIHGWLRITVGHGESSPQFALDTSADLLSLHGNVPPLDVAMASRNGYFTVDGTRNSSSVYVREYELEPPASTAPTAPETVSLLHIVTDSALWSRATSMAALMADDWQFVSLNRTRVVVTQRLVAGLSSQYSDSCDFVGLTNAAQDQIRATALEPGTFDLVATTLPWEFGGDYCDRWAGIAYLGGRHSWTKLGSNDAYFRRVMFHEVGHNFGLGHASADGDEYGDDTCSMGDTGVYTGADGNTLSALALAQLGWAHPVNETLRALGVSNEYIRLRTGEVVSFRGDCGGHDAAVRPSHREQFFVHREKGDPGTERVFVGREHWRDGSTHVRVLQKGCVVTVAVSYNESSLLYPALTAALIALLVIQGRQRARARARAKAAEQARSTNTERSRSLRTKAAALPMRVPALEYP